MDQSPIPWRNPQGFTAAEEAKAERVRRLRARFSRITSLYLQAKREAKSGGLFFPALLGLAIGVALYFGAAELLPRLT